MDDLRGQERHERTSILSDMTQDDQDTSDCYTREGDPSGLTGVNRYAIALLRGTANAGELDGFDHCKYLPVIKPEDNAIA